VNRALLGVASLAALLAGCTTEVSGVAPAQTAPPSASATIQVKGSDTMVNLGQAWAEAFMKVRPSAQVSVTGGGSGTGIAALANGTCQIAQCSRSIKAKEKDTIVKATGKTPTEVAVGIDALVVAVHPKNEVESLTFEQLSGIFTGKIANWKEVGGADRPVVVLSRERNSGTHVYFLEHVVRQGNEKGPEEYAASALMMPSSQAIVDELASNEGAIGYYGLGYLGAKNKALSVAKTKDATPVAASAETALAGTYPIARSLFFYVPGDLAGDVKAFVDFVLSDDGQRIVKKLDFVPLRAIKE
jgi:phosphate transport system substrate-binding protein